MDISIKLRANERHLTEVQNESVVSVNCQSGDGKSSTIKNKVVDGGVHRKGCLTQSDLLIGRVQETSVIKFEKFQGKSLILDK